MGGRGAQLRGQRVRSAHGRVARPKPTSICKRNNQALFIVMGGGGGGEVANLEGSYY
jgi:hypothetical protein